MADYYRAAEVYLHAAKVDTFPTAVLESLACGTPVVATRVGGPPEFVTPGAGVLVDPLDEEAIAAAMRAASALPSPNDAARAAAAEHDVNRQAARIEAILERISSDGRDP